MRTLLLTITAVLLATSLLRADHAAAKKDADTAGADSSSANAQPHDVIYLSDQGPVVIRFRVLLDGRPQEEAWETFVGGLFDSLDADGDGRLAGGELSAIPSAEVFRRSGLAAATGRAPPASPDRAPRDGRVTRDELERYFREVGFKPFSTSMTSQNNTRGADSFAGMPVPAVDLFATLDRNQDGRLGEDEFSVDARMRKQDLDDDQTLSAAELVPYVNPYARLQAVGGQQRQALPPTFLVFDGSSSSSQDVKRMLDRYDGKTPGDAGKNGDADKDSNAAVEKDNALSAAELGTTAERLGESDADGNGRLDFDELRQWLRAPLPDVEVVIRLGKRDDGQPSLQATRGTGMGAERVELRTTPEGSKIIAGTSHLELGSGDAVSIDYKQQFDRQFDIADMDKNGYIDEQESRRLGSFANMFSLLDADGDGKIFKKEIQAFVERWAGAARCGATLDVADQGRKLFEILDTSGDGRLTERELRAGAERIADWDADGDDALADGEIPGTWRLNVGQTALGLAGRRVVATRAPSGGSVVPRRDAKGPAWFYRMDRNGDGEVARREFLGPLADFDRLDRDADGILTAGEAGPAEEDASAKKQAE